MAIPYLALGLVGLGGYLLYRRSRPTTPPAVGGEGSQTVIIPAATQLPHPPLPAPPMPKSPTCSVGSTVKDRNLSALMWMQQRTVEVQIFKPAVECDSYVVQTGICLAAPTGFGYGDLSKRDQVSVVDIREDKQQEFGGIGIDWASFASPVIWKQQYRVNLSFKGGILKMQLPYMAIPDSLPDADPCPLLDARWPISKTGVFWLVDDKGVERIWQSEPQVDIAVKDNALIMRLKYAGLPYFKIKADAMVGRTEPNYSVGMVLNIKTQAEGHKS